MTFGSSAGQVSVGPNTASVSSRYLPTVNHGSTAGTARVGTAPCRWIGSVDPTNATDDDELYRKDLGTLFVRVNSAWVEVGSTRFLPRSTHLMMPSGGVAATLPRKSPIGNTTSAITSGRICWSAIDLVAGQAVSAITFYSGPTAAVSPTNQWFAIADASRLIVAITANDTTTAWGANTAKTLSVAGGPWTAPTTGVFYVGQMVEASTPPSLLCAAASNMGNVTGLAPYASFRSTGSYSTTSGVVGTTAAFNTAIDPVFYAVLT